MGSQGKALLVTSRAGLAAELDFARIWRRGM